MCTQHTAWSSEWSSDLWTYSHPAALNELFTRHLLTAEESSEVARNGEWEDHLNQVLSTKPAEVAQEACQVLEKHGCSVKKAEEWSYTIVAHFAKLCSKNCIMPTW